MIDNLLFNIEYSEEYETLTEEMYDNDYATTPSEYYVVEFVVFIYIIGILLSAYFLYVLVKFGNLSNSVLGLEEEEQQDEYGQRNFEASRLVIGTKKEDA